jgi:hypothetical protein
LSDFLRSFSLADLRPDSQTIQHAAGVIPQALPDTKGHFAFYFDGKDPMEAKLNLPSGTTLLSGSAYRQEKQQSERSFSIAAEKNSCKPPPI